MEQRVNCMQCKHYFVTWDNNAPKGCKAFGFKSSTIPSIVVKRSSGEVCLKYEKNISKGLGEV